MSPIPPPDPTSFVPRREFIRDQRPASTFAILALSGAALLRLYSFSPDVLAALRKHLDEEHLILGSRELIQNNFYELSLDGKPWSNPKTTRSEKLLIEILAVLYRKGHNLLSTLDYGREQDDRIVMAFSRPSNMPLLPPQPSSAPPSSNAHSMSKDSVATHSQPVKVPFAISFISQSHLRVIAPPLHLTPAILQTVRGSWPRGVVSEKKVAENVYEFKLKGYRWFQEDTFATDSLRHVLSLLGTLDGFGFTLLTSLSLSGRSRSKDLWVFTGPIPPEYPSSTPPGSRTDLQTTPPDKVHERRRSHPAPTNTLSASNLQAHTRAMTESSIARPSHSSVSGLNSHKSGVVRKPAPRAQLPVSVAHTSSNDNVDTPNPRPTEFRMEMQSSIGSAVDMTGVGTQKYPRPGESDIGRSQQAPFGSYIMTPGANPRYFSSMSASVLKASQPSESVQGAQSLEQTTGRTDTPSNKRETIPSPVIPRPRPSPVKATPQPGTPIPPLLGPGAFRDSLSSNTGQTVDGPNAWTGVARENGHASGSAHDRDPKDNVLPGGWIPTSSRNKESKGSGDYADEPNAHLHNSTSPYKLTPEEQEVKVSVPEVVHPRSRLPKSGEATIVAEAPRDADINRAVGPDRLPPMKSVPDRIGKHQPKTSTEGWVLVSVGQPGTAHAPQTSKPTSQPNLRRKKSHTVSHPPLAQSPYSTGSRGTGSPVGSGHKKASSNPNPSSMSAAAKAIVIIDAMEAKRKATGGDSSQSAFRKFFSLSRPDSPNKSSGKERRTPSRSLSPNNRLVEQEDNSRKREGGRERWRAKGTPSEVTKSDQRIAVD